MSTALYQIASLFHPDWYESLERYQPGDELLQVARTQLPSTWHLVRKASWFCALPTGETLNSQGWKIHVSATPLNCAEILQLTAATCVEREIAFKFALDTYWVTLSTSNLWAREASGKFITIYPRSTHQFQELLEALYQRLQSFSGPYILSDKRYKDAAVLYYRYGGISDISLLTSAGEHRHLLRSPQGMLLPDQRLPYWSPPAWVSDPFAVAAVEAADLPETGGGLKEGRYQLQSALKFSVSGGVYLATDATTGKTVLLKEARPYVNMDPTGKGAIDRLQREYALLQKLQGTGLAPVPIDLFWDWEHLFLVEEYLSGPDLSSFIVQSNPLIQIDPVQPSLRDYVEQIKPIWCQIIQGVALLRERGIIYGDFSLKNIILSESEPRTVRFIDFEAAWEEGEDPPVPIRTPGFMRQGRAALQVSSTDQYALGALMLGCLFPINQLLAVEPAARTPFLQALSRDLHLPPQIPQLIESCMHECVEEQPGLPQIIESIQQATIDEVPPEIAPPVSSAELLQVAGETMNYIRASADLLRDDRLFPSDPAVFSTNPLSVAYGATGVIYALSLIDGEIPTRMRSWLLSQSLHQDRVPTGLYLGLSGIAWVFWQIGLQDVAVRTLKSISTHPLVWDTADIFYGAAGYGLTCLHFFLETRDSLWLDCAVQVGERLLQTKVEVKGEGYCWPDREGDVRLGYAHGASGIALYLLYLGVLTQDQRLLDAARRSLAFDLAHLRKKNQQDILTTPRGVVGAFDQVVFPYWFSGSAGIATVLLRFCAATGDPIYEDYLRQLAPDTFHAYSIFPGLFRGLAGLGNFQLDAYQFLGDKQYLQRAQRSAQSILLYQIPRPQGVSFPGEQLLRISTDFATGGAGIALFLQRLAQIEQPRSNFNFTVDQILYKKG